MLCGQKENKRQRLLLAPYWLLSSGFQSFWRTSHYVLGYIAQYWIFIRNSFLKISSLKLTQMGGFFEIKWCLTHGYPFKHLYRKKNAFHDYENDRALSFIHANVHGNHGFVIVDFLLSFFPFPTLDSVTLDSTDIYWVLLISFQPNIYILSFIRWSTSIL